MPEKNDKITARELLSRIGLDDNIGYGLEDAGFIGDINEDLSIILKQRYQTFTKKYKFMPGDIVTWKPGLQDRRLPRYGQPAVVMEVLTNPILDPENESGSPYFHQRLDIILGIIAEGEAVRGELITFYFDSRRFQPWSSGDKI
ncbi:hypothetical protein TI04_11560 [Achromatium sp. WMS2]|nr:hypothetical protein TI04_11560 [Achromatium sp. WMS2]